MRPPDVLRHARLAGALILAPCMAQVNEQEGAECHSAAAVAPSGAPNRQQVQQDPAPGQQVLQEPARTAGADHGAAAEVSEVHQAQRLAQAASLW